MVLSVSSVSTVLYCMYLTLAEHRSADSNQRSLTKDKAPHRTIKRTHYKERSKALIIVKYVNLHEVLTPDPRSV